jgi:hypothetical protein
MNALNRIQDTFEEVTGLTVEPELQEIDNGELIVEVSVGDSPLIPRVLPSTKVVSRAVDRSEFDVSVLSGWVEERPKTVRARLPITSIVHPSAKITRRMSHSVNERAITIVSGPLMQWASRPISSA